MPPTTLCSLCISTCNTFKCLYNDDGQLSEVYYMVAKYFDPMFLRPGKYSTSVICTECWQHITDFHTFQQTVINTQYQQEYIEPIVQLTKLEELNESEKISLMQQIDKIRLKETTVTFDYDSERVKNDDFIAKCKGMLECVACHEMFETYSLLRNHFRMKHPEKEWYINCCKHKFYKRQKLMAHIRQHHNRTKKPGKYQCELCTESFSRNSYLSRHNRLVHNRLDHTDQQGYKCDICGLPFVLAFSLKKHMTLNHNPKSEFQSNLEKHREQVHSNLEIQVPLVKIEPAEEGLCAGKESLAETNSMVSIHNDDKTVETLENEISSNVELRTFTKEQKSTVEQFGDNVEIYKHKLEETLGNDNQIIDNTKPSQFLLSSEYPKNEIQKPPLDIVDIKDELPLDHDNDSNNEPSEPKTAPLNIKIRYSKIHKEIKEMEHDAFIAKHKGDLECPLCKGLHANYSLLREHFRDEHTGEKCYIVCCQLKLNSRYRLFEHLQFHINPKAYECDVCGKCFKNTGALVVHKQLVHIDKQSSNHHYLCGCKKSKELYAKYDTTIPKEEGRENVSRDFINQKYYSLLCCQLKQRMLGNDATIAKWNSELFCRLCGAKFSCYSLLRDHFCSNHPQENFYINCCQRKFYKIVDFLDHIRIHLPPNDFKCEICNEYLMEKSILMEHMSTAHKDLSSIASTSTETKLSSQPTTGSDDMTLDRITTKSTGMEEDIIAKQNECNDISMELSENNSNTEKYRRFDAYIAKWKGHLDCVICKTKFANYSLLKRHFSNNHLDQEVHIVCCNRKITKRFKIVEHIRKFHNHVKNLHKCKMCSASFPQYIKLRRHYFQVHNPRDKYEFKCETCGAAFKQRRSLKKHILNRHSEKSLSLWFCQECHRSFKIKISLENHMKKFHSDVTLKSTLNRSTPEEQETTKITIKQESSNNDITASTSSLPTQDSPDLQSDEIQSCQRTQKMLENDEIIAKWYPQVDCRICKEKFTYYSLLRAHFYCKHPQERCYILCCQRIFYKTFDAVDHIRIHLDPHAFKCDLCNKSLSAKSSLKRHMRKKHGRQSIHMELL